MKSTFYNSLVKIREEFYNIKEKISRLSYSTDYNDIARLNKLISKDKEVVSLFEEYLRLKSVKEDNEKIIRDKGVEQGLLDMAKEENSEIEKTLLQLEKKVKILILPTDERDSKNVIIELRGAAGGEEANIFVKDIYKMYIKYSEKNNWKTEILNTTYSNFGFSQIEFKISGKNVYSKMKYEAGVHRVQRVPETESKGRIHTSTISVAVLPEASGIEVQINPSDLKIDTYRASGAGGQHVNKTDSAVRITHLPTNIVVASQDGRSQHGNKDKAMEILKAKIYNKLKQEEMSSIDAERKKAVGLGDRTEKIRTYNYPQNRVTDHRIPVTINRLNFIMEGDLNDLINPLIAFFHEQKLKSYT